MPGAFEAEAGAVMAARLLRAAVRASALCRVSSAPVLSRGMAAGGERINSELIFSNVGFYLLFNFV